MSSTASRWSRRRRPNLSSGEPAPWWSSRLTLSAWASKPLPTAYSLGHSPAQPGDGLIHRLTSDLQHAEEVPEAVDRAVVPADRHVDAGRAERLAVPLAVITERVVLGSDHQRRRQ